MELSALEVAGPADCAFRPVRLAWSRLAFSCRYFSMAGIVSFFVGTNVVGHAGLADHAAEMADCNRSFAAACAVIAYVPFTTIYQSIFVARSGLPLDGRVLPALACARRWRRCIALFVTRSAGHCLAPYWRARLAVKNVYQAHIAAVIGIVWAVAYLYSNSF